MLVKIGDRIYDSSKQPIMIVLSDSDKKEIANMPLEESKYCVYPNDEEFSKNVIKRFMKL